MTNKSVYLMGIGGIGMANVAVLLKSAGFHVTGSDANIYEPAASLLQNVKIEVKAPYNASNLPTLDTPIIVGNAHSRGHIEVETALTLGYALYSFPEFLCRNALYGKDSIVVSGTHGKSTTTACLSHLLEYAGLEPSFLIGAQPANFATGGHYASGKPFVIEGDEYDSAFFDKRSKFLHYFPKILLLGTVEFDHADIFTDLEDMLISFRRLVNLLPENGLIVYNSDCEITQELANPAKCRKISVGTNSQAQWRLLSDRQKLSFVTPDQKEHRIEYNLLGAHNRMNALMSLAAAVSYKNETQKYFEAIASFRGIKRRLEKVYESSDLVVYDDFAHHPTAIESILSAIRESYSSSKIIAVVEPRSNTMVRNIFQEALPKAFRLADQVIFGSIHRRDRIPETDRLDLDLLSQSIRSQNITFDFIDTDDIPFVLCEKEAKKHAVVVFMSNGSFNSIVQKYISRLAENEKSHE